jgi:hypothetical protein
VTFKQLLRQATKFPLQAANGVRLGYRAADRLTRVRYHGLSLNLVQDNTGRIRPSDILLVTCLRNEVLRLPYFLDYYRRLGVDHFLIVDNDSNDGFRDYIAGQTDCSVWRTTASYLKSNFGMQWCNALLGRYGPGHLCVTVDPDEFFIYPHMESRSLRDLGLFLKDENRRSMHALMLDAYSEGPYAEAQYTSGDDPFEVCPYFDRDGYIQRDGYGGGIFIQGGPRMRIFNRHSPEVAPALNKIPLVWWRRGYTYRSSMHDMVPASLNRAHNSGSISISGCLMHFKFMSLLEEKAKEEQVRKQHYAGGREYKQYLNNSGTVLYDDGVSVRYESWRQLVDLGLMSIGGWN